MGKREDYFDDVYIGPPVPPSVFYRGRKAPHHHSCIKGSELTARAEAERLKQQKQQRKRRNRFRIWLG